MSRRAWIRKARQWLLDKTVWCSATIVRQAYDLERSGCEAYHVGRLKIYGSPRFVGQVTNALGRLEYAYANGYSLVQRYVYAIEQDRVTRSGTFPTSTLTGIGVQSAQTTEEGDLLMTPERYGGLLVRFATDRRRILVGIPRSDRAYMLALKSEQRAMKFLLAARGF